MFSLDEKLKSNARRIRSWLASDGTRWRSFYAAKAWSAIKTIADERGWKLHRKRHWIPVTWPDGRPVLNPRTGKQLLHYTPITVEMDDGTKGIPSTRNPALDALLDASGWRIIYLIDEDRLPQHPRSIGSPSG